MKKSLASIAEGPEAVPESKPARVPPKKSNHLNLRCPECAYYAKTTKEMLKMGRLVCPVDPDHGQLMTAEERGERRGNGKGRK